MSRLRYRIEVRTRRGEHHARYVEHDSVKPGKAQRLVDQTAIALARHEANGRDLPTIDWHLDSQDDVCPVSFAMPANDTEFVVTASPVTIE